MGAVNSNARNHAFPAEAFPVEAVGLTGVMVCASLTLYSPRRR
jgi:hypothetical protein